MTRSLPEFGIFVLSFSFNLELAPALRVEPAGDHPLGQVVNRGSPEPLSFAPLPSDWTSSNLGGIFPFWHGALVSLDLFPDFTPGRGFTLALLWMIPTTCIPAGRMVPGVDDLCELLRPTAFAVALFSTRTGPYGGRGLLIEF